MRLSRLELQIAKPAAQPSYFEVVMQIAEPTVQLGYLKVVTGS